MRTKKTKEEFEIAAKNSYTIAGMCRLLGWKPSGSYNVIKKYIKEYNIDVSHFTGRKATGRVSPTKLSAEEYAKSYYCKGAVLLKKIIEEGYKEKKCECCNNTEWNGKPIPLELHHIDGNHFNNDFENLKVLCPNCHAQTENYKGRKQYFCKECGKEITKYSKTGLCSTCNHKLNQRKVEWPTKDELEALKKKYSMVKIGKMFGVSDKTIKKWVMYYGIK